MARKTAVDDDPFCYNAGSSAPKTCGVESDSPRGVCTLTQQPNLPAEALGSNGWRSGTLLWLLSFVPANESDPPCRAGPAGCRAKRKKITRAQSERTQNAHESTRSSRHR